MTVVLRALAAHARSGLRNQPAVVDEFQSLDYEALDLAADSLAAVLTDAGVQANDVVAVLLGRGCELISVLVAVWKAGAGYVVLDPGYPPDRLAAQAALAGSRVLVTNRHHEALAQAVSPVEVLLTDDADHGVGRSAEGQVACAGGPIAYVNFTSGSTGTPKPVVVPMSAVENFAAGQTYVEIKPGDHVMQAATAAFDAFTFEVWATLFAGGAVVVTPPTLLLEGADRFRMWSAENQITVCFLTTSVFELLIRSGPPDLGVGRTVIFGGEPVDPAVVEQALAAYGSVEFIHAYGPTETTTFATVCNLREWAPPYPAGPTVGRPLNGVRIHIEDGEVFIGGDGVALGYAGQPGLTAERFVPDPASGRPGARVYRSGDRGYLDQDQNLVLTGRIDRQVKIRGYRIELGEIEAVLRTGEGVENAVAVVVGEGQDKRLVGLYTGTCDAAEVRLHLRSRLPGYMVPNRIERIASLPIGGNGKLDARAVAAIAAGLFEPSIRP